MENMMIKICLVLRLIWPFFFCHQVLAYGLLRSPYNTIIRWPGKNIDQTIYLNPRNSHGISSDKMTQIFKDSLSQWNNTTGNIKVSMISSNTKPQNSQNDAYFSKSALAFKGAGVLAFTQINFQESSGVVIESDIIFKDITLDDDWLRGSNFVTYPADPGNPYIGGVAVHEIGHFLGLGHSLVLDSTMFYLKRRGQHHLIEDDRSGIYELYGIDRSLEKPTGTITGNIVGGDIEGDGLVGILGSHIKAISVNKGRVVAGAFSNSDGHFNMPGLDLNDTYYLYVEPIKETDAVPRFYSTARTDFCPDRKSYRGAFFQSCYDPERGYPQGIGLTSTHSNKNVGNISIQCGLDSPVNYLDSKDDEFDVAVSSGDNSYGNTFVGFFTTSNVSDEHPDIINLDFRDFDSASGNYHLEIKVLFHSLYSQMKANMTVENNLVNRTFSVSSDDYNNPVLDLFSRVPLSRNKLENNFTVTLTPEDFDSYLSGAPYLGSGKELFYPNFSKLGDDMVFYLLTANISQRHNAEYIPQKFKKYGSTDNTLCPGAKFAYYVEGDVYTSNYASESLRNFNETGEYREGISCGTINFEEPPSNGGNGPLGLILGMLLTLFSYAGRRIFQS